MKPYALYLLERFEAGESAEELATSEGILIERIRMRLAAAREFVFQAQSRSGSVSSAA